MKKTYAQPELVVFGSIAEITGTIGTGNKCTDLGFIDDKNLGRPNDWRFGFLNLFIPTCDAPQVS